MDKKQSGAGFISGAIWLSLSSLFVKIIGLIYKVPLSYILGDEGMGYFNSAYTIYTLFLLVGTAGIPRAISIIVAKSEAETEGAGYYVFKKIINSIVFIATFLFLVLVIFGKSIADLISAEKAVLSIYAVAPSIFFVTVSGVFRGYLNGKSVFYPLAISEIILSLIKLILGLAFAFFSVKAGNSLLLVSAHTIAGITIGTILSFLYLCVATKRRMVIPKIEFIHSGLMKRLLKISLPLTLSSALASLGGFVDLALIMNGLKTSGYSNELATALYGNYSTLAIPMFSAATTLITPITTAIMPGLAVEISQKVVVGRSKNLKFACGLIFFIAMPLTFFLFFFSKDALLLVFDSGSATLGYSFLSLLAPSIIVWCCLNISNTVLEAEERVSVCMISLSVGILVKFIVTLLLLNYCSLDMFAAPIGTLCSYIVSLFISSLACRKDGLGIVFFIRRLFPFFIASTLSSVFTILIKQKILLVISSVRICSLIICTNYFVVYALICLIISKKAVKNAKNFVTLNKKRNIQL